MTEQQIETAAIEGDLATLKRLNQLMFTLPCQSPTVRLAWRNAMDFAAASGHIQVVRWLHENRSDGCTVDAMNKAAFNNDIEMVLWLHENRTEGCSTDAMDWAATAGHLHMIQWLHHSRSEGCTGRAIDGAACGGHLHVIKWLADNYSDVRGSNVAIDEAATRGHQAVVEYLVDRHGLRTTLAITGALENGYNEIVRTLHQTGHCPFCGAKSSLSLCGNVFQRLWASKKEKKESAGESYHDDSTSYDGSYCYYRENTGDGNVSGVVSLERCSRVDNDDERLVLIPFRPCHSGPTGWNYRKGHYVHNDDHKTNIERYYANAMVR